MRWTRRQAAQVVNHDLREETPCADTDRDTVYHTVSNEALGRNDDGKPYS